MKIESGKWYRMRNGEKAWIAGKCCDNIHWLGTRLNGGHDNWYNGGSSTLLGEHKYDLISLWEEPKATQLPEKIALGTVWEYYTNEIKLSIEAQAINQLIDYCESLEKRLGAK